MGIMQTAVFTGTSLGPLAGGIAGDAFGFRASFLVAAAFLLSGGLLVLVLVHEEKRDVSAAAPASRPFWEGIGDVLRAPALLAMIAAVFAVEFALTVVIPV